MNSAPARYRLTVNATLAEWVAHFQESSLQNYFCDFFTKKSPRAANFESHCSDLTKANLREGRLPLSRKRLNSLEILWLPPPQGEGTRGVGCAICVSYRAVVVARLAMRPL